MQLRNFFTKNYFSKKEIKPINTEKQNTEKKTLDNLFSNRINYLFKKRRESIINSMTRPLYQEVLKSLFLIFVLIIDALIPLEIIRVYSFTWGYIIALIVFLLFLYAEGCIYNHFWGKNGRWSIDKYKKISEEIKNN
ncbi:MAG: hypothetical protein QHH15_04675 [Candidatus Thermoplasmatota archaeon]|jgi:ABC-type multidrug transport system fused ATPase/permease subunit|nr:hypothetical protein [Candidatus Thermoplasmatota archaeon]